MVATPWGESETLRERRLRPGPGVPREEVERHQRERLFGATVACMATKGYEACTVADLTEISGVSSRTFYDMFSDKRACFLATLDAMIEAAIAYAVQEGAGLTGVVEGNGVNDWERQARLGVDAFTEMVVAQPAAARMALIESYVAGPEALARVEQAVAGFEWLTRQTLEASPERAGMPAEMVTAYIGMMREIVSTRLRQGREAELPAVMDSLWDLITSYRPPPEPLLLSGRPTTGARRESLEVHDHAERAIRAFAMVVAEKGYEATTVDEVLKRAAMSATTFYADFSGKDDALMAAIDTSGAQMVAAVVPAFRRASEWPLAVRAGVGALLGFLAWRPALARLVGVEVYAAGPAALQRRVEATQPLRDLLAGGYELAPKTPRLVSEGIAGAVYTLIYRQIREKGTRALPALAPLCTYITLIPFIGPREACGVANGDGRGRA